MAKDKDAGSFKLEYELSEKDPNAGVLISARLKHTPGKIRVQMDGGIPGLDREGLAAVHLLLSEKVAQINDTLATQTGNHVSCLRIIGTYCNELANMLALQELADEVDDD